MPTDTIAAISTPLGRGAIGIVRASGPRVRSIIESVLGFVPNPRHATLSEFRARDHQLIDRGIAVFFPGPDSFTGEDLCEFHGHGSLVVLQQLLENLCATGARAARPGEFSERAFRNGKIDLAQAEAIADLIGAQSARAARSAMRTLQGEFSEHVTNVVQQLTLARAELEGSIDFPDDIPGEHLSTQQLELIASINGNLQHLLAGARQGARLNEGAAVAIIGAPNVGKSTLMNRLARQDKAIVSDIPGTTRDVIETETLLDDLPVRLYDTAGLRASADTIEAEGIRRAVRVMDEADVVMLITDQPDMHDTAQLFGALEQTPPVKPVIVVHNKIDLYGRDPALLTAADAAHVFISARDGRGFDLLVQALVSRLGIEEADENEFVARTRHVVALQSALSELSMIDRQLLLHSPELVAESLRRAGTALAEITGAFTTEDLLAEIFSRFCLGK